MNVLDEQEKQIAEKDEVLEQKTNEINEKEAQVCTRLRFLQLWLRVGACTSEESQSPSWCADVEGVWLGSWWSSTRTLPCALE